MRRPVVQAPMAGGPSTPALAAAVSHAGGLGTLAAGYLSAERLAGDIAALRELLPAGEPFGVNLFAPTAGPGDPAAVAAFAALLEPRAAAAGVALGEPQFDDDAYDAKLELLAGHAPAVVSFAFGLPREGDLARLQAAGAAVWITVTARAEAELAIAAGADAVIAQGGEAGGHRGSFTDHDEPPLALAALLAELSGLGVPVIAAGGIMDRRAAAHALAAGAAAVQCGTAFLRCPESGTAAVHQVALGASGPTVLTRAFSGRRARAIANAWSAELSGRAPAAYPELHHLTAPLRAHGRASGDPDLVNLWAGTGHAQARQQPAAEVVGLLDPAQ
jgi:nitronate monooxygenase